MLPTSSLLLRLILFISLLLPVMDCHGQITGRVIDANHRSLPQVNIVIKGTDRGTQTNARGEYSINTNPGEILVFSHVGMQTMERHVEESPSVIHVEMQAAVVELEGVEKETWRRRKTQKELLVEYPTNLNLIKTTLGILDKELSSTHFRIIDGKDLVPVGTDFLNSLEGHIPHIKIDRDHPELYPGGVGVLLRQWSMTSNTVLFDVDGFVTYVPPTYLHASDIERMAVMEGNSAFIRYGSQGTGGVIVINTTAQTWMDDTGIIRTYNNSSLADSLLKAVTGAEPYLRHMPHYMEEWQEVQTEQQAMDIFISQQGKHYKDPYYFLDVFEYFLSRWGTNEYAKSLIEPLSENFSKNVPVLKALAYLHQKHRQHEDALNIYLEILKLSYDQAQSHRDVANAYAQAGDFRRAMEFYTNYIQVSGKLTSRSFDAYGNDFLITTEIMNLMKRDTVSFLSYDDAEDVLYNSETGTRLVFEWNNPDAEFELQFVTPDGYYDTWTNNQDKKGYNSKQFFIDGENEGEWQVIIDYAAKRSKKPTYLKVSLYQDYGLESQYLDIKVYKLSEKHVKELLFTFLNRAVR